MTQGVRKGSRSTIWTPANIVTLLRVCLVPVFVIVLISPWPEWFGMVDVIDNRIKSLIAAGIFILISCTDWIDGYLARSRGEVTDFGKFMDPLADKILVAAALLALVELQVLPSWPVLVILIREFIVSGIRMMAASKGRVIAASWYGKAKTVFQIVAIVLFLVKDTDHPSTIGSVLSNPLYVIAWIVMIIALVLTVISMLDYIAKAKDVLGFGTSKASSEDDPEDSAADAMAKRIRRLAEEVVELAKGRGATIGTAESLTGGLIASALTEVPGSSSCVSGGIVSYVNEVKSSVLKVDPGLLETEGAVDAHVAEEMANGAARLLDVDLCVSVTGIAGPTGEEPGKPIGTVFMGLYDSGRTSASRYRFNGDRDEVRLKTVEKALEQLQTALRDAS